MSNPGSGPDPRRSAWFAATRRRLGVSEDVWSDPAVDHVLEALDRHEPLDDVVTELGSARGTAGFDLRETMSDLDALAEVLAQEGEDAESLPDQTTVKALSAWADAFIDRVHPPACVDAMTGLVTLAYLRVRLAEVHRECDDRHVAPGEAYALVITGPSRPAPTPLARLASRLRAGRCIRDWFPGGESACHLDHERVAVLAPRDDRLAPRARGLARALAHGGTPHHQVVPLAAEVHHSQRLLDDLASVTGRPDL